MDSKRCENASRNKLKEKNVYHLHDIGTLKVVWATTTHVGCGKAICGDSVIIACDYLRHGNDAGMSL